MLSIVNHVVGEMDVGQACKCFFNLCIAAVSPRFFDRIP